MGMIFMYVYSSHNPLEDMLYYRKVRSNLNKSLWYNHLLLVKVGLLTVLLGYTYECSLDEAPCITIY